MEVRQAFCWRVRMAANKQALWAGSSLVAWACSCASTTSMRHTSAWSPPEYSSWRRLAMSHTGELPCFWIWRGTAGTSWDQTRVDRHHAATWLAMPRDSAAQIDPLCEELAEVPTALLLHRPLKVGGRDGASEVTGSVTGEPGPECLVAQQLS